MTQDARSRHHIEDAEPDLTSERLRSFAQSFSPPCLEAQFYIY